MKLIRLLTFFLIITGELYAQQVNQLPTLQVTGNGKIQVKPDKGIITIMVTGKSMDFNQAIVILNEKVKDITRQIIGLGFKEEDIKTTDFRVNENKIYTNEGVVDSGYIATQNVKIEFVNQKETITKVLNAFSKSKTDFNLNFDFRLSDMLKIKTDDEVLKLAITDSRKKAELIAAASGIRLKKILNISYGQINYGMKDMSEGRMMNTMAGDAGGNMMGFIPSDIILTDSIVITWEIE